MEAQPRRAAQPDLNFAYLMTGTAIECIAVSGVLYSIFTPDLASTSDAAVGYVHQHTPRSSASSYRHGYPHRSLDN